MIGDIEEEFQLIHTVPWYGEADIVTLKEISDIGCKAIVSTLQEIPAGEVWGIGEINERKSQIGDMGMKWLIADHLPVHDDVKAMKGDYLKYIENYKQSLINLATCGITTVTYRFTPVLDGACAKWFSSAKSGEQWTVPEREALIIFDLFMLKRKGAQFDYRSTEVSNAAKSYGNLNDAEKFQLEQLVLSQMNPGDPTFSFDKFREKLCLFEEIDGDQIRDNLCAFLKQIIPVAEKYNLKMAIYPDRNTRSVFGLPNVTANYKHLLHVFQEVRSPSNGLCLCTASLSLYYGINVQGIIYHLSDHINFVHLLNVNQNSEEDTIGTNHLFGEIDMYRVVKELINIMWERRVHIPARSDQHYQLPGMIERNNAYNAFNYRTSGIAALKGLEFGITKYMFDN